MPAKPVRRAFGFLGGFLALFFVLAFAIAFLRAFTVQTALCLPPGRDGCGTRVHTIPESFATSTAATR